ncbi:MAG: hypothetical protein HYZ53_12490 [Planctomycetes bacterium]|nr:hypothetical protein [Planctomycetota bacterium]
MRCARAGRSGLSLVEVLILVMILLILFLVALPILLRSRILNHEGVAIQTLRLIYNQELAYQQTIGRLGTLAELVQVKRLDAAILAGPVAGYKYRMELIEPRGKTARTTDLSDPARGPRELEPADPKGGERDPVESPTTWSCQSVPELRGSTGERSFHLDQTGAIHAKDTGDDKFHPPDEAIRWPLIKEE